jgi:hypothetical protein
MKLPLVVCLAALAAPLLCRAQAPIRVEVSLVNVGFSVRDEKGNLVTAVALLVRTRLPHLQSAGRQNLP